MSGLVNVVECATSVGNIKCHDSVLFSLLVVDHGVYKVAVCVGLTISSPSSTSSENNSCKNKNCNNRYLDTCNRSCFEDKLIMVLEVEEGFFMSTHTVNDSFGCLVYVGFQ